MTRDFTNGKQEEIYRALEDIEHKEWKPFMAWCGTRAREFGGWQERLDIAYNTRQVDDYQHKVLNTNRRARKQIETVFENERETDQRYAEILRGYAEDVGKQIAQVRALTMLIFVGTVSKMGFEKEIRIYKEKQDTLSRREKMISKGTEILSQYLESEKDITPAEKDELYALIMENRTDMLLSLYAMSCYSSAETDAVYKSIMDYYNEYKIDYYNKHKMDITMEDVEDLDSFLRLRPDANERQIQKETFVECWNRLGQMGLSEDQIIAVMANIYAESGFSAKNKQDTETNKKLCDEDYEFKTDDGIGYGLCQWTWQPRKQALKEFADDGGSVYDLETQLNYFQHEMEDEDGKCHEVWKTFLSKSGRDEAVDFFRTDIEITEASLKGKGHPDNEKESKERIGYADAIAGWYDWTFKQEVEE